MTALVSGAGVPGQRRLGVVMIWAGIILGLRR
jgi:hypothetical protein